MSFEGPSSPAHKRLRLSSPTYDELMDDFDDEALEEISRIELTLSQKQFVSQTLEASRLCLELTKESSKEETVDETRLGSQSAVHKEDNDHTAVKEVQPHEEGAKVTGASSFTQREPLVKDKYDRELSSSPQAPPPEPDYSNWFNPETSLPLTGFQRASKNLALSASEGTAKNAVGFVSGVKIGTSNEFASAVVMPDALLEPSESALYLAAKRLEEWAEEDEISASVPDVSQSPLAAKTKTVRPALVSVSNTSSFRPPLSTMQNPTRSISTPNPGNFRTFRSPLIGKPSPQLVYPKAGGGLNENGDLRPSVPNTSGPSNLERPLFAADAIAFTTPVRPSRQSGLGSLKRPPLRTFSTPFKPGMRPGEPGRIALEKMQQAKKFEQKIRTQKLKEQKERGDERMKRHSLKDCGFRPQRFTIEELESMDINVSELSQITPQTAPFYVFYPDSSGQAAPSSSKSSFGPAEAHAHLQNTGRTHASRKWVDNQWRLVLWKLAGMACLEPQLETTPARRWCWRSVLDQLEKRYDKEMGRGARPALRLVTTQDTPASAPMILLVTRVIWAEPRRIGPDGRILDEAEAELEVSDGWYRLHASVDAPLARAVTSGTIKPGRKIAVAGAKLDNDRKEPSEILEAYESCTLLLGGNGTHLAPWYAKLGFQPQPFIATLGSLTPDGGPVPLMDLAVEKVYPIAYIEYKTGPDGKKIQDGPYSEEEEAEFDDKWQKLRDAEEAKVREELEARWGRWDGFADRLESCAAAAAPQDSADDDSPPDHIDDLFDELDCLPQAEVGPYIRRLAPYECIHLARFLRRKSARDKELAIDEIEVEMKHRCPSRNVSNFRVVIARDALTSRKPANRIAQLTIWGVLELCVSEGGKAGAIEVGQRFLMTNLNPTQHRSWMGHKKDSTVYLATRKNTRFIRLK